MDATPAGGDPLPLTSLRGVGPGLATRLAKLGIRSVQDLYFHLPVRYEDRTRIVPIGSLRAGERAVIEGETEHDDIVIQHASRKIADLSVEFGKPVGLGITGPGMSRLQAEARITRAKSNPILGFTSTWRSPPWVISIGSSAVHIFIPGLLI